MNPHVVALASVVGAGILVGAARAQLYTLTPLPYAPGHNHSAAAAVNNFGVAVGESSPPLGPKFAAHWTAAGPLLLPTLPGASHTEAVGINFQGEVAGRSGGTIPWRAVLWSSGTVQDLGTLGGTSSYANAVNDRSQVVGFSSTSTGAHHAFLWSHSTGMVDLGTFGSSSSAATGINNAGTVVGYSGEAFIRRPATGFTGLGTLGGEYAQAWGINDLDQVVGSSAIAPGSSVTHGFIWQDGVMTDLGSLAGKTYLYDINNAGVAVGLDTQAGVAVAWVDGAIRDLNTITSMPVGWHLWQAWAINDSGQNVGKGWFNGQGRAFMLTPIPAPGSIGAIMCLAFLGLRRVRPAAGPATR